ncbi:LutC/YkgG family protein [Pelagicoccus albus]|uniref:LUD domain-containing protein n=1 Tax=Pelagicoccus albus TaxID=415222 RepID=A0A7X1E6Y8_9BACT|nr:LUD domain-containing protein [Pelagicoccus albus]MBC2605210.1 LUD domain-containing protein [Pelagicoccus albus]
MSSDREKIFSAIRSALAPLPERAAKPDWDNKLPVSRPAGDFDTLEAQLADKLAFASSRYYNDSQKLAELLLSEDSAFGYCDPELAPLFDKLEGITFETEYDESKIDEYRFGITKATAAVAESGTLMFTDRDTSARLGALAPWIHVAVVKKQDIVATVGEAISKFGDDPSIIFATGPSKTADVEGILIEGVHGPGIQVAFVV